MKRLAVVFTLLMLSQVAVSADENKVNYEAPYYNKPDITQRRNENYAQKNSKVYKESSGNQYLLKYNIDDLESAPWLNNGKRKYE